MRTAPFLLALPFVLILSPLAYAQGASAEDLFREGVSLFSRGETAAACERFERSYKLDAAPGTLFNLASCHERQGRLSQARLDFADLVARSVAAGKPDKVALARGRLASVEARLPHIALAFPPANNIETVLVDDVDLPQAAWHELVPVDLGVHTIELRATGFTAAKLTITAREPGALRVELPMLTRELHPATVAAVPAPAPETKAGAAPVVDVRPAAAPASSGVNVPRLVGYVVGGVGLIGLGVGAYFVSQAVSEHNQADGSCGANGVCASSAATSNAEHLASMSTTSEVEAAVAFGIAVVGIGAGVALIATAHTATTPSAKLGVQLAPVLASHFSGLSLIGRF